MFSITFDGYTLKYYVDAVQFGTTKTFSQKQTLAYSGDFHIGSHCNSSYWFNGLMSDLRIYATALNEVDIQGLYGISASVANTGSLLLAGEIIEK